MKYNINKGGSFLKKNKNKLLNELGTFYKPNIFKISFVFLLLLFVISFLLLGFKCGVSVVGKEEYKCGPILNIPITISFWYIFFIGFISSFIPQTFPIALTFILGFIIHVFLSYLLACLLYVLWKKIKK